MHAHMHTPNFDACMSFSGKLRVGYGSLSSMIQFGANINPCVLTTAHSIKQYFQS
jgi:hypothetical protein